MTAIFDTLLIFLRHFDSILVVEIFNLSASFLSPPQVLSEAVNETYHYSS